MSVSQTIDLRTVSNGVEYTDPVTITATDGADITTATVELTLGTFSTPGVWRAPDLDSAPTANTRVVSLLVGAAFKVADGTYYLWSRISDTPERLVRREQRVIIVNDPAAGPVPPAGGDYTVVATDTVARAAIAALQAQVDAGGGGGGAVSSVAGKTGAVSLAKGDVGLGNVDNTADTAKPVSTAQAAAIAAAVSAAAINPNDVGYDLVLLLGQSNMAGRGTVLDARLDTADPRVFSYGNPAQTGNAYNSVITQAVEPLLQRDGATGVGPGLPFARWYTSLVPANRRILLIPCAYGGTPLVPTNQLSWNSSIAAGTNSLYQYALATVQAALAQAGPNSRIVAALWLQGETDGDSSATGASYQAALDALIAKLRIDLALPALPFVIGQLVPDYLSGGTRTAINAVHLDTPRRLTGTGFGYGPAGSAYNNGDGNHYNAFGQRGPVAKPQLPVGESMFRAYQRALANVTGVAPVVPAAPTLTQTAATAVTVTGQQVTGRVTDYLFRYRQNGGTWATLTRTSPNLDVVASLTGLTAAAQIEVQAATVNEQGTSAWSPSGSVTLVTAPNAATALTAGTPTASTVPLTFTASAVDSGHSAATAYLIERSSDGGGTWAPFATVTGTAATVTGLTANTAYTLGVTAQNVAGNSARVTTTATTAAGATVFTADSFAGTAGQNLSQRNGETAAVWAGNTGMANSLAQMLITAANRLRLSASTQGAAVTSGAPPSADYSVQADFVFLTIDSTLPTPWILGRASSTAVTWYGIRYLVGSGWQLCKYVAGSGPTILATYNPTVNAGETHQAKLTMVGTTISMLIDGAPQGSATDSAITAAGNAGIYLRQGTAVQSDITGIQLDNFQAA